MIGFTSTLHRITAKHCSNKRVSQSQRYIKLRIAHGRVPHTALVMSSLFNARRSLVSFHDAWVASSCFISQIWNHQRRQVTVGAGSARQEGGGHGNLSKTVSRVVVEMYFQRASSPSLSLSLSLSLAVSNSGLHTPHAAPLTINFWHAPTTRISPTTTTRGTSLSLSGVCVCLF